MKKLISLLVLCAAGATVGAESNSLPFRWDLAVKADVAPPSEQPVTPVLAAQSSEVLSAPLFYSAQRNIPPLPFNPHPELPLFDLGGNRYMYDDSQVDFVSLFSGVALGNGESGGEMSTMSSPSPCNPCGTNSGGGGGGAPYSGPPAYNYSSTQLWVKITSSNVTNFLLDVNNTVSNTYYGVLAKTTVSTDPFNTWSLVNVFQAKSTSTQFLGTASALTRFHAAVNLDAYAGPSVSIVSPAAGTTVSNDVTLQVRVTDILPLTSVKVFVGAVQVGVLRSNQNGTITVPTRLFPNGQQQIWVAAVNEGVPVDTDGDTVADGIAPFQTWANVTVKFTNEVRMQNYSPLYSGGGSLTFQYSTVSTQNYTFEVFKTNGTLLHTTNGQFSGTLSRQWNFKDLSGNTVTDGVYAVSLTYSNAAAAAPKKIITTNLVDEGVDVGKYVISYGEYANSTLNTGMADMNTYLSVLINSAAYFNDDVIGSDREDYNPPYVDFSSDAFKIRKANQTNDYRALTNALKDVITGSFLFQGHSGPNGMIAGADGYLTVDLTAAVIADLLGNAYISVSNYFSVTKYGRRLFSTMITGCAAATSGSRLTEATGTPAGVDQVGNSQIKKSAFLGFIHLSEAGSTKFSWINRIHSEWLDGADYDTPLNDAFDAANTAYPAVLNWDPALLGYRPLKYHGYESR